MIKLKEEEERKKGNKGSSNLDPNYEEKQCKLCFDKES